MVGLGCHGDFCVSSIPYAIIDKTPLIITDEYIFWWLHVTLKRTLSLWTVFPALPRIVFSSSSLSIAASPGRKKCKL